MKPESDFSEEAFKYLVKKADSLIFTDKDEIITRHFLDNQTGVETFEVDTSEILILFNRNNELVGKAKFRNFEYYADMVEGQFYTHYKMISEDSKVTGCAYSLYNSDLKFINNSLKVIKSSDKDFETIKQFKDYRSYESDFFGYTLDNENVNFALFSYDSDSIRNGQNLFESKLIKKSNDKEEEILRLIDNYILTKIYIIPVLKNGHPIVLFDIHIPGTDYFETVCAKYDKGYKLTKRKIKVK